MIRKKILVAEDEFITTAALKVSLEQMGFEVVGTVDTGEGAVKAAAELKPDLILMDIILKGDMTGITAAGIIKQQQDIPVVYFTAHSDDVTIASALETEPFGYILKPFDERNMKTSITMALYKHTIDLRLKASEERYRTIAELFDDGIFIIGDDCLILYLNKAAGHIVHRKPEDVLKKQLYDLLPEDWFREIRSVLNTVRSTSQSTRITQEFAGDRRHFWFDITYIPLATAEDSLEPQVMMVIRDVTDRIEIERKMDREGIVQIEKNMEQFQILNDQIINPVQVIKTLTELENGSYQEKILEQTSIIEDLVAKLDKGWIESEKVRNFLLRHYRHGDILDDKD